MSARVLVIKLSALGDFVQAFGPFAAIRARHPGARVTLLTTPPYAPLARLSPWFDEVWEEGRPSGPAGLWRLARRLRAARFGRVYDLQTSTRSSRYRWLVGAGPEWSGIARGASHPHDDPGRDALHTVERQRAQLRAAGLSRFPEPDLAWLEADLARHALPEGFALLIPGASPARPGKRWPGFPDLARRLDRPVVVAGGAAEAPLAAAVREARPDALDLSGRTSLVELAALARRASLAVGNDTGPTHLAAAAGAPTLALFGPESDPALCGPRGRCVRVLRAVPLGALPPVEVAEAAALLLREAGAAPGAAAPARDALAPGAPPPR